MCQNRIEIVNPHYKKLSKLFGVPLHKYQSKKDYFIVVPCGHCDECLKRRSKSWYSRADFLVNGLGILAERCYFCTFTLKPEVYEEAKETPYVPVRRFIDRLRKHPKFRHKDEYGKTYYDKVSFPYFFVVEFADGSTAKRRGFPSTHRMHYHAILFDPPLEWYEIEDMWERFYGRSQVEPCDSVAGIHYVLKYVTKDNDAEQYLDDIDARKNGKLIVSHGFGRLSSEYKEKLRDYMLSGSESYFSHFIGNYRYPIPKYWKNVCFSKDEVKGLNQKFVPPLLYKQIISDPLPEYRRLDLTLRKEIYIRSVLPFLTDGQYKKYLENGFDVLIPET